MKYNAIIFDLDGVICNTDRYHYRAWKEVADRLNIFFDETVNQRLRGVSRKDSFDIILEKYEGKMEEEEKEEWIRVKNEIYVEMLGNMSRKDITREVTDTLRRLLECEIKCAIGSSSKNAGIILEKTEMEKYFEAVADGNHITHSKPDPEIFLLASTMLGENCEKCLVVEDAEAGVRAAQLAGMDCATVGDACKKGLGKFQLKKFSDILNII